MDTAPQLPRSRTAAGEGRVSILVVMDTAPQLQKIASTAHASSMFQSLLLWIPLLNTYFATTRRFGNSGFNPCCYGYRSSTGKPAPSADTAVRVSILVVMDTAPQLGHRFV